jgi:ABC-type protease/lipase transport system fused ATPase/permease subunit
MRPENKRPWEGLIDYLGEQEARDRHGRLKRQARTLMTGNAGEAEPKSSQRVVHAVTTSIETCRVLSRVVGALRSGTTTLEEALESLEDAADIWDAEFDESVLYKPLGTDD